jgi:hypothetical protein
MGCDWSECCVLPSDQADDQARLEKDLSPVHMTEQSVFGIEIVENPEMSTIPSECSGKLTRREIRNQADPKCV